MKKIKLLVVLAIIFIMNITFIALIQSDNIFWGKEKIKEKSGINKKTDEGIKSEYTLNISISPTGAGAVTKNPDSPGGVYSSGSTVQLTAYTNYGFNFKNWSGALTGTENPKSIVMNANKSVTANFTNIYFQTYMIPEKVSIPTVTSFSIGRPSWETGNADEQPVHPVNLNAFYMSKYEITIKQYVYFLNAGGNDDQDRKSVV